MLKRLRYYLTGDSEPRVNGLQLSVFTRQLATMLDAGIPLHRSLSTFSDSLGEDDDLGWVLNKVAGRVAAGFRFSRAMRLYPTVFSPIYTGLAETGENSGRLSEVLVRLADTLEKQVKMQQRVVSTLTYPFVLLSVALCCLGLFVVLVLPASEAMFRGLGLTLPWPTKVLLASRYVFPWAAVVALLIGVFLRFRLGAVLAFVDRKEWLRSFLHGLPFRIPLAGTVYRKVIVTRILYTLASMVDSGVGLVQAIKGCQNAETNCYITRGLGVVQAGIVEGHFLSESMAASDIFPVAAVHIIRSGEETSSLPRMIQYAADMFDEDTEMALLTMANAMEPLLMAGMGLVVGFIVIAAMMPTLQLIANL